MVNTASELGRNADYAGLFNNHDTVLAAIPELQPRAKTVLDLIDLAQFIYAERPLAIEDKAAELLTPEALAHLEALKARFEALSQWTVEAIDADVRAYA